jgi:hypothetical protein
MSEWWTYTLSDIQSFSLHSYYRLFELYNAAIWPAQIVVLALGLAMLVLLRRAELRRGRLIAAILAACWLWIAIAFHAHRYATLTWSARYFAWGFGLEAALLIWTGVVRGRLVFERRPLGLSIILFALVVHPLIIVALFSRTWRQVEIFGVAPDPTAIATLGVLLLATGRVRWELMVLPLLWCAISGATLLSMKAPDAGIPLAAAVLVVSLAAWQTLAHRQENSRKDVR